MTNLEAAITKLLTDDAAVSALLGSNVWAGSIPEDVEFPALYFELIHEGIIQTHSGVCKAQQPVYLFEWSASSLATVKAIRKAVYNCLLSYRGTVQTADGPVNIENILSVDGKMWPYDSQLNLYTWQAVLKIQYQEDLSG